MSNISNAGLSNRRSHKNPVSTRWASPLLLGVALNLACSGLAFSQQVVKWGVAAANLSFAAPLLGPLAPEIFAKHGVKLEISDLRGSSNNCMTAMLTGQIDVCHLGTTTGMDVIAEGGNIKAFGFNTGPIAEISLSAKAFAATKLAVDAPIESRLRALKGLRFVSSGPGTPNYAALVAMLAKAGLTIQDIRFRTLTDPVAMLEGMRNDQIDGSMWSIGPLAAGHLDKTVVRFVNLARGDVPEFRGAPYLAGFAQAAWIEKNQDLVQRVQAALAEATALLRSDQGKYSALLKAKYGPDMPQPVWSDIFQQAQAALIDGKTTAAGWNYMRSLQTADSKRDYSKASFENSVLPIAQQR